MGREYTQGRDQGARSDPQRQLPTVPAYGKPSASMPTVTIPAIRPSSIPTDGTKTAPRTAARAHQQAAVSRQHIKNVEAGMTDVVKVTSLLKEVQLSENEKGEALKAAATKKAEAAEKSFKQRNPSLTPRRWGSMGGNAAILRTPKCHSRITTWP
ncbi:hypothetical protein H9Q69_003704 [Fusarium xylarioides]|uniref:Uncharacterized protein n=1 Tax=Fusarium xylarioides TaxID=221167 RepID=A0A9P7L2F4_9HYPO|nr:hypothetical protein H9Q72_005340 [Fusarium xylarioides]KAG5797235.1 hypothetical protein H9Q69_003704 [Fusarium xylarioides]